MSETAPEMPPVTIHYSTNDQWYYADIPGYPPTGWRAVNPKDEVWLPFRSYKVRTGRSVDVPAGDPLVAMYGDANRRFAPEIRGADRNERGEYVSDDSITREVIKGIIDVLQQSDISWPSRMYDKLTDLRLEADKIDRQRGRAEDSDDETV